MESGTPIAKQKFGTLFIFGIFLLAVSSFCRLLVIPTITSDYTYFVAQWFEVLGSHKGLTAFLYPFSDYAPLYLYCVKILTFIPVYSLWSAKTLSFIFDIFLAFVASKMVTQTSPKSREVAFFVFALMLSIPTVVINSSLWGQSDSAYASFAIASLYFLSKDKLRFAAIAFGIAISFKLQAIFFLPIIIGFLLYRKKAIELLWIPAIYVVSTIPALIGGASLSTTLFIYAHQSSEYTSLNVSSPSVFAFIEKLNLSTTGQSLFFWIGIAIALCVAVCSTLITWRMQKSTGALVFMSLWCTLLLPYFLPRMHERYFYLADICSVILALYFPRSFVVSILVVGASLLAYMPYLSGQVSYLSFIHIDLRIPSSMLLLAGVLLTSYMVVYARKTKKETRMRAVS